SHQEPGRRGHSNEGTGGGTMNHDDPAARQETAPRRGRDLRYGFEEAPHGELPREPVERRPRHTAACPARHDEWKQLRLRKELVRRSCADCAPSELRERIAVQCRTVSVTRTETGDGTVQVTTTSTTTRRSYPAP